MGIFSAIGQAVSTFCTAVWKGLLAIWDLVKKVVSTLFSWAISVLAWAAELAVDIVAGITAGIIVAFIWIFGDDSDYETQDPGEVELGRQLSQKLDGEHKKIVINGLWDKQKKELVKGTKIETTNAISSDVKKQTGSSRFAELKS